MPARPIALLRPRQLMHRHYHAEFADYGVPIAFRMSP